MQPNFQFLDTSIFPQYLSVSLFRPSRHVFPCTQRNHTLKSARYTRTRVEERRFNRESYPRVALEISSVAIDTYLDNVIDLESVSGKIVQCRSITRS